MPALSTGGGTTSACAENTNYHPHGGKTAWNYLRVRGEYIRQIITPPIYAELPPRARRIQQEKENGDSYYGTTSACAENTLTRAG